MVAGRQRLTLPWWLTVCGYINHFIAEKNHNLGDRLKRCTVDCID